MSYTIKEIYYTLQGEGAMTGRPSLFLRFAGCNIWSGLEKDRATAVCKFCDTDFIGTDGQNGGKYIDAQSLVKMIDSLLPENRSNKFIVCTGGEPLLQLDTALIDELHRNDFQIAIETNGTIIPPDGLDWICVSPKADSLCIVTQGDEIKIIYPQEGLNPKDYEHLEFNHFYLQPMDNALYSENVEETINYCLKNPRWKLSLQTHKILRIP